MARIINSLPDLWGSGNLIIDTRNTTYVTDTLIMHDAVNASIPSPTNAELRAELEHLKAKIARIEQHILERE